MKKTIEQIEQYLFETLGIRAVVRPWENTRGLPVYLKDDYQFYSMKLFEVSCVLMIGREGVPLTPAIIARQVEQVRIKYNVEVVYGCAAITSYDRKRLIDHKVSFIIPDNQMYLPFAGVSLREHLKRQRDKKPSFSPATQALIIYVLHHKDIGTLTPAETAKILGCSAMTMTRAFDELETAGIGEHSVSGKMRHLGFSEAGKSLWEKVLPYLKTPVKNRLYIASLSSKGVVLAGISALAHYTTLGESEVDAVALSTDEWQALNRNEKVLEIPSPEAGSIEVEVWKYSPAQCAQEGCVDRLSLYLSLKDNTDERVVAALGSLLGNMTW